MISITILTKNSEKTLRKSLLSTLPFTEVIILDSGSTDKTLSIAEEFAIENSTHDNNSGIYSSIDNDKNSFVSDSEASLIQKTEQADLHSKKLTPSFKKNVKIFKNYKFEGFGMAKNFAASLASNDWIFSLDSDETISPKLAQELLNLSFVLHLEKNHNNVYSVNRINYYNNKEIKWCGWQNEKIVRFYNKKATSFSQSLVHEAIITDTENTDIEKTTKILKLKNHICHYPYLSIDDFLKKMQLYTTLFAQQNQNKKKSSFKKALFHGVFAFFKSYIIKRGFLGGAEGFFISMYNANTSFYKYLKLKEFNSLSVCNQSKPSYQDNAIGHNKESQL